MEYLTHNTWKRVSARIENHSNKFTPKFLTINLIFGFFAENNNNFKCTWAAIIMIWSWKKKPLDKTQVNETRFYVQSYSLMETKIAQ